MMDGKTDSRDTRIEPHQDRKPGSPVGAPVSAPANAPINTVGRTNAPNGSAGASPQSPYAVSTGFDTTADSNSNPGTTATINPTAFRNSVAVQESGSEYGSALRDCVAQSLRRYFTDMNGQRPEGLYNLVINEIEYPLLITVMRECNQNQSRAAKVLGINRNTLRKKLKHHGIV